MRVNLWANPARGFVIVTTLSVLAIPGLEAQQQPQQQRTMTIAYRKTAAGKAVDQRKYVETNWKKWAQVAVDDGRVQSSMVLRLTAPYANGSTFDYATISFPAKRPSLASPDRAIGEAQAKKAGFAGLQAYLDMGNALSSAVRTEWLTTAMRIGSLQAGNYIRTARYMVADGQMTTQIDWLRDVVLPASAQSIKDGRIVAWGVNTVPGMVMTGAEAGFNLSTFAAFKDADSIWEGPVPMTEARLKQVFPTGMSLSNYLNRQRAITDNRKPTGTRIWEVVAVVGKTPEITPARPQ